MVPYQSEEKVKLCAIVRHGVKRQLVPLRSWVYLTVSGKPYWRWVTPAFGPKWTNSYHPSVQRKFGLNVRTADL